MDISHGGRNGEQVLPYQPKRQRDRLLIPERDRMVTGRQRTTVDRDDDHHARAQPMEPRSGDEKRNQRVPLPERNARMKQYEFVQFPPGPRISRPSGFGQLRLPRTYGRRENHRGNGEVHFELRPAQELPQSRILIRKPPSPGGFFLDSFSDSPILPTVW